MKRFAVLLALALVAGCSKPAETPGNALSANAVAAETRKLQLQPGQWETTTLITAMNVAGLPAGATQAATGTRTTTSNCITPAEAARPDANILSGTKDGNCTYQRFSMAGEKIDAAMTCAPAKAPGKIAMTLAGTHARDRFDMDMGMKTDLPGGMAMTMKAAVTGRRTGVCTTTPETPGTETGT
jgi:hypothetical protein